MAIDSGYRVSGLLGPNSFGPSASFEAPYYSALLNNANVGFTNTSFSRNPSHNPTDMPELLSGRIIDLDADFSRVLINDIISQRAFEGNMKAVQAFDDMIGTLIDRVG